jgi:hypothetical protein
MITRDTTWTPRVAQAAYDQQVNTRLFEGAIEDVLFAKKRPPFRILVTNLLGECLTEPLADLIVPKAPAVTTGTPEAEAAVNAVLEEVGWSDLLYDTALRVSIAGEAVWKLVYDPETKKRVLRVWGLEPGEFATFTPDGKTACFWYDVSTVSGTETTWYKVREMHTLTGGGTTITNKAWQTRAPNPMDVAQQPNRVETLSLVGTGENPVGWDKVAAAWDGVGVQPEEEQTIPGLTTLPGYTIPNIHRRSDYTATRLSVQTFLTLIESCRSFSVSLTTVPQLMVPPEAINPETGEVDWAQIIFSIKRPGSDYVTIDLKTAVTSLGDSARMIDDLWADWYAVCPISPIFYGRGVGSNASGVALDISLSGTVRAVERRRQPYTRATRWLVKCAQELASAYQQATPTEEPAGFAEDVDTMQLEWAPVIAPNAQDILARIENGERNGWMSRRDRIRIGQGITDPDAVEEKLTEIQEEEAEARLLAAPAFTPGGF